MQAILAQTWTPKLTGALLALVALQAVGILLVVVVIRYRWYGHVLLLLSFLGGAAAFVLGVLKVLDRDATNDLAAAMLVAIGLITFLALGSVLYLSALREGAGERDEPPDDPEG